MSGAYTDLHQLVELGRDARTLGIYSAQHVRSALSGQHRSRLRGRGIDFDEVRRYQAGDDIRSIDWRVTARSGIAHTKLYHEERERPVVVLLDQSPAMFFGSHLNFKSVTAAECAAALAWAALEHGDRIGGLLATGAPERLFRPYRSRQTLLHWLQAIVDANQRLTSSTPPAPANYLADTLASLYPAIDSGAALFIISDGLSLNEACEPHLHRLGKHHDLLFLRVTDPLEHNPPEAGLYPLKQSQGQAILLNTRSARVRQHYQQGCTEQLQRVEQRLGRFGIPLQEIDAGQATLPQLQALFPGQRGAGRG
ncbi:DUF58 domain-containing protein [Aestuariirhabdus litorea]|uniref:DUF58 domain-containing protein n=1 Tax=Aestuariirhabdus litorea TaxID=2528527 RepID=A0A3P3VPZ9_9GAMM|nr:DUF58 domain-containing protein [Aestuariirhabdus litorea]RRJ84852.1 DUF58 domain-containing protein [Aestuariirhabdus litorea]RWW98079.1 DUF58 domain-containing protein [Endozoicomonadaceae bacterium GTF-13]